MPSGSQHPLRILVVEDFELLREAVAGWLKLDGHAVATATGGIEAVKLLASEHFDLVLTDIIMPEGDGIELIRHLRSASPSTGIIAMSAGNRYFTARNGLDVARALGADCTLAKPFDRNQLSEAISLVCPPEIFASASKPS